MEEEASQTPQRLLSPPATVGRAQGHSHSKYTQLSESSTQQKTAATAHYRHPKPEVRGQWPVRRGSQTAPLPVWGMTAQLHRPSSIGPDAPRHRPRSRARAAESEARETKKSSHHPKRAHLQLLSRWETARPALFSRNKAPSRHGIAVTEPPATAGQLRPPHSLGVQSSVHFRIRSLSLSRHEARPHTPASRWARQRTLQPSAASAPTKQEETKPPLTHRAGAPRQGGHGQAGAPSLRLPKPRAPPLRPEGALKPWPSPLWGRHRHCTSRTLKAVCFCPTAGLMQDCRPAHDPAPLPPGRRAASSRWPMRQGGPYLQLRARR